MFNLLRHSPSVRQGPPDIKVFGPLIGHKRHTLQPLIHCVLHRCPREPLVTLQVTCIRRHLAQETRVTPGSKSWAEGRTAGCPGPPNSTTDIGLRAAHCDTAHRHTETSSWHEVNNHHRHVELLRAVRGEESVPVVVYYAAWWDKHEKLSSRKHKFLEGLEPRPRAPLRDDQHKFAAIHQ